MRVVFIELLGTRILSFREHISVSPRCFLRNRVGTTAQVVSDEDVVFYLLIYTTFSKYFIFLKLYET